jgi:AcrR family transcriptional regulator
VIARVLNAAIALLEKKNSRDVSVAEIANAAELPRASVLLQFPDGLAEIADNIIYSEYMWMFESDQAVPILDAAEAQNKRRGMSQGLESAMFPLRRMLDRASSTGRLYSNLTSEALLFDGGRLAEHRGRLGMLGFITAGRLAPSESTLLSTTTFALGELVARSAWDLAAGGWEFSLHGGGPTRAEVLGVLLESLLPRLFVDVSKLQKH